MFVCRHFKLILHRDVDVLSSDFKALVIDDENRPQNIAVDGEFYHGFDECKFSIISLSFPESHTLKDIMLL